MPKWRTKKCRVKGCILAYDHLPNLSPGGPHCIPKPVDYSKYREVRSGGKKKVRGDSGSDQ